MMNVEDLKDMSDLSVVVSEVLAKDENVIKVTWWSSGIHNGLRLGNPDVQEVPSSILAPPDFQNRRGGF